MTAMAKKMKDLSIPQARAVGKKYVLPSQQGSLVYSQIKRASFTQVIIVLAEKPVCHRIMPSEIVLKNRGSVFLVR